MTGNHHNIPLLVSSSLQEQKLEPPKSKTGSGGTINAGASWKRHSSLKLFLALLCGLLFLSSLGSFSQLQSSSLSSLSSDSTKVSAPAAKKKKKKKTTTTTNAKEDGCGLVQVQVAAGTRMGRRKTQLPSSLPQWRALSHVEQHELDLVQTCQRTILQSPPIQMAHRILLDQQHKDPSTPFMTLDCHTNVTLATLRDTLQHYRTIWFFGDSIMEQVFYLFTCMMDTTAPFDGLVWEKQENYTWHHHSSSTSSTTTNNRSNASRNSTHVRYSRFGWKWDTKEPNLYHDDFPTAISTLGEDDAIVINANVHYDSTRVHLFDKALTWIAEQSFLTKASVFYLEPTPEDWPTSNGMYTKACMWRCRCEAVNPLRLLGRGNYTDPTDNITQDFSHKLPPLPTSTVTTTNKENQALPLLSRLYPDLAFAHDTEHCLPDCLPATWRVDMARSILWNQTKPNNVIMVPLFWQLIAKGTPTPRMNGDCTHRSLEAVHVMNQQLIRTMMVIQQQRKRKQ
ncbi:hypothetical protein ACA910_018461 [Epithemia clementina (nom. ined.)]